MTIYGTAKSYRYQFIAVAALLVGTKQKLEPLKTHQIRAECQEYKSVWELEGQWAWERSGGGGGCWREVRGGSEADLFLREAVW